MTRMATPFLKWAGGKGKLAPLIAARVPRACGRFHEPFVGGGAVFFAVRAAHPGLPAAISDANGALVDCYLAVQGAVEGLIAALRPLAAEYLARDHDGRRDFYYRVRAAEPRDKTERAARLIFLNRTCYNGLYRVNANGGFNVPHGRYANPRILDEAGLRACSAALAGVEIRCEDFEAACDRARPGDFVYLDPPYQPLTRTANFTAYTAASFGPREQERLRDAFEAMTRRGVFAVLSNSDHPAVRDLYDGRGYRFDVVPMSRAINSAGHGRAPVPELLIDNFARAAESGGP
ncbi:MAG: DNA adenine methylase [Chloroflexi bacterium]|nr:DNA adenine methylase [Chloroflexota bacterium]